MGNKKTKQIKKGLAQLEKTLARPRPGLIPGEESIKSMLKRRGFTYLKGNPKENLLLPLQGGKKIEDQFYHKLKKYSFRLFLRDVIKYKDSFQKEDLSHYCSGTTVDKYLKLLLRGGVVVEKGSFLQLSSSLIKSFGDTFEWFVAQVFEQEFHSPASWGIKLKETKYGGDYDVMALVEDSFVYVETKSSPPKHVEGQEISAFLDRVEDLRPNLAIFLEDTQLRMKDKIVVLFEEELKRRYGKKAKLIFPIKCLEKELFFTNPNLFIINTHPDLVSNLGFCLRYYFRNRGISLDKYFVS